MNKQMDAIESHSAMVGYYEILPYAKELRISVENNDFIIDDQYCISPGCPCADAVLVFIPVGKKPWKVADDSEGIFVNYKKRKLSETKPSRLKDVGRNDPCPCGSGKKYKNAV